MKSIVLVAACALLLTGCQSETALEPVAETSESAMQANTVAFNVDDAPTAELEVPDMHCQYSCAAKVKEVLTAQPGVIDVKIDFDSKTAIVAVDKAKFDGEAAVAALVDYQFSNTKLVTAEAR